MGYYGLTKEQAEKEGYSVVEGTARFDQCLRGRVFAPDGLLKLVVDEEKGTVLGCHLIGKEAAEMVHYGMALVKAGTSIFDILQTVYTAVTFHELFKEAALDANSKLDFGVEWQEILAILASDGADFSEEYLREKFEAIDEDGSGELEEDEMRALFDSMGRKVSKRIIANIMRLSDTDGNGTIDFDEFKAIFDKVATPKVIEEAKEFEEVRKQEAALPRV
jgi:Ca2+-binding EF-hand superfamily protein